MSTLTPPASPAWPGTGPAFNHWYDDLDRLVRLVREHPNLWLRNSQLKYLSIRIDTRFCRFVISDCDGNTINPGDVLAAVEATYSEGIDRGTDA